MQERLSRFLTDRLAMLAAISHDLRTPITVARLRAEMVEDNGVREAHRLARCRWGSFFDQHSHTRPYTPKTNGKAERFIQTALREWA
jgi:signal transduction histidine kinase